MVCVLLFGSQWIMTSSKWPLEKLFRQFILGGGRRRWRSDKIVIQLASLQKKKHLKLIVWKMLTCENGVLFTDMLSSSCQWKSYINVRVCAANEATENTMLKTTTTTWFKNYLYQWQMCTAAHNPICFVRETYLPVLCKSMQLILVWKKDTKGQIDVQEIFQTQVMHI